MAPCAQAIFRLLRATRRSNQIVISERQHLAMMAQRLVSINRCRDGTFDLETSFCEPLAKSLSRALSTRCANRAASAPCAHRRWRAHDHLHTLPFIFRVFQANVDVDPVRPNVHSACRTDRGDSIAHTRSSTGL